MGVVAYRTSTGAFAWSMEIGGAAVDDWTEALAVAPGGGRIFLAGVLGSDLGAVALRAGDGAKLWSARYEGTGGQTGIAYGTVVSPDGTTLYVVGQACFDLAPDCGGGAGYDYETVAYESSTGSLVWARRFASGDSAESATSAVVAPDGTAIFVTGDVGTVAYAA